MRRTIIFLVYCVVISSACAQKEMSNSDIYFSYFEETAKATKAYKYLWDKDLYAPMLLVDLTNGLLYANEPDDFGVLKQDGKIYVGELPDDLMVANTASKWNGKTWAMIQLPLPEDYTDRINLLTHELFHVAQPDLGFTGFNSNNVHLDEKDARIYLRLELEALKKAVHEESSESAIKEHLTNAVIFRKYRNSLYEGSEKTENQLELNEGLAEYTGMMHAGRSEKQANTHFIESIDNFCHSPTFIRSFAYQTIPVYGYLLQKNTQNWNKNIDTTTNLIDYFTEAFDIQLPDDLEKSVEEIISLYDGKNIVDEETIRDENMKRTKAIYREKFVELPHLELYLEQMTIGFDFNIFSLDEAGTVYIRMEVRDKWGFLDVENGALMSPGWNKITVALPFETEGNSIVGDGWTLELNDDYELVKDESTENYSVAKK